MSKPTDPFAALERAFHEPKRLALMSALIGSGEQEMTFTELKDACDLTDGNLNRHLHALAEVEILKVEKKRGSGRPTTVYHITPRGRKRFLAYIDELESVVRAIDASEPQRKSAKNFRLATS